MAEGGRVGNISLPYADQRMGELVAALPTKQGKRSDLTSLPVGNKVTKTEALQDAGLTPKTASQLEQLAANPEVVEAVIAKAQQRIDEARRRIGSGNVSIANGTARDKAAARHHPPRGKYRSWCKIWCKRMVQNLGKKKQVRRFYPSDLRLFMEPAMGIEPITTGLQVL